MTNEFSLKLKRDMLKLDLISEQATIVMGAGYKPVCPHCWEEGLYNTPTDMHEGLIKRGDVQTWPIEDRMLIYVRENCVVLCHHCHITLGQTKEMTRWFVRFKYSSGYNLGEWLETLPFKVETERTKYVREYLQTPKPSVD